MLPKKEKQKKVKKMVLRGVMLTINQKNFLMNKTFII
jgi:hypothetical protein